MKKALTYLVSAEENPYYQSNSQFFLQLKDLVESNIVSFFNMLHRDGIYYTSNGKQRYKKYNPEKDRRPLLAWINASLPKLQNQKYNLSTKCYWILNGLTDFPKCAYCGKSDRYVGKNVIMTIGYRKCCTPKCAANLDSTRLKYTETSRKKFGVDNCLQLPECRAQACATKALKYGDPNFVNPEKAKQTRYAKNGGKYESDETKELRVERSRERYGVDYPVQAPGVGDKISATRKAKTPEEKTAIELKKQVTWQKSLGVTHPSKSPVVRAQVKATTRSHYGVDNFAQSVEYRELWQDEDWKKSVVHKVIESKRKKGTLNSSRPESRTVMAFKTKFGSADVLTNQNKDPRYPRMVDIYVKSLDMFVECNFHWTHGGHFFDPNSEDDKAKLAFWRERAAKKRQVEPDRKNLYEIAEYVWTNLDVRKTEYAVKNGLRYLVFWSEAEAMDWLAGFKYSVLGEVGLSK